MHAEDLARARRRARKTNSIWRWLKRSVCSEPRLLDRRRLAAGRPPRSGSIGPAGEGGASPTRSFAGCSSGRGSGVRRRAHEISVTQIDVIIKHCLYSHVTHARQADQDHRHGRPRELGRRGPGAADRGRRRRLPPQLLPRRPRAPRAHDRVDPRGGERVGPRGRCARRPAGAEAADRRAARRRRRAGDRHAREADPAGGRGRRGDDPGRLARGHLAARGRAGLPGRRVDPAAGGRGRGTAGSTPRSRWAARSPPTRG